jgi:hypothetical protein
LALIKCERVGPQNFNSPDEARKIHGEVRKMSDKQSASASMRMLQIILVSSLGIASVGMAHAAKLKETKFWNLTGATIVKFELGPAGSGKFGQDQCKNDKDGAVDDDERLRIEGVASGPYDARITYKNGRVCLAKAITVEAGKIFSIETKQLTNCTPAK